MTEHDLEEFCNSSLKKGDVQAAINCCDKFILENPDSAKAFRKRAGLHAREGDFEEAVTDVCEAIRIKPDEASYYFFRGWWNAEMGNFVEAEIDQSIAIKLECEQGRSFTLESAYFFRSLARLRLRKFNEALSDTEHVSDDFIIYLNSCGKVTKALIVNESTLGK